LWDKWWMIFEWEIRKEKLTKHMLPFSNKETKKKTSNNAQSTFTIKVIFCIE
jgi:hypothetical protein